MLQKLLIQNYAIIEELSVAFSPKLNVITGETGAGKSIIAGALGLILGQRADSTVLLNKEKKCVVEGVFRNENNRGVSDFLTAHDFDQPDELLIRREISNNGKSRAFINDTPVSLSQLQSLASLLVDLHQQFDALDLGEINFQREVLDALAGQQDEVKEYSNLYQDWLKIKKELDELKEKQHQFEKETDYNRFQFNELREADFREKELEETEAELKLINHAEEIKSVLEKLTTELKNSEEPVVQKLKSLYNQLNHYSSYHPELPAILERLQSVQVDLNEIAGDTERINDHIYYDAQRLNGLNERLSVGYKLQKKHGVQSTNELLEIQQQLEEKLQAVLQIGDLINQKEKETGQVYSGLMTLASKISAVRQKQVKPFEDAVNKLLHRVGMPNARLKVDIQDLDAGLYGTDRIEFLFNANTTGKNSSKDISFMALRKVASGGELNRLMLCIKSLVAESVDLPTLIFDEIDSGISGEAARQVGIIMKELAAKRQMICITHQPQIAGKADEHFFVYKEIVNNLVKTNIRQLSVEERITTIAKMLSGEKPTAAAMENAREMVRN